MCGAAGVVVEKRRVLAVVDHHVDLFAARTLRVDDERPVSLVSAGQVIVQETQPVLLRGLAARAGLRHRNAVSAQSAF
jgi:hypothetical protein